MSTRRVTRAASSRASSVAASDIGSDITSTARTPRRSSRLPPVNPRESTSYGSSTAVVASEIHRRGHERDLTETLADILGPAYQNYENQENQLAERDNEGSQVGRKAGLRSASRAGGSRAGGSRVGTTPGAVPATPGNNDNSNSFGLESSVFGNLATPGLSNTAISPVQEVAEPHDNSEVLGIESLNFWSSIEPVRVVEQQVQNPSFWRQVTMTVQGAYKHTVPLLWKMIQWVLNPLRLVALLLILGIVAFALTDSGRFIESFKWEIQKSLDRFCTGYMPKLPETFDPAEIRELQKRMTRLEQDINAVRTKALYVDEKAAQKLAPLVRKYQLEYERDMAKILRRVNHFSANNGAIVNPYTTSPSYQFSNQRANIFWRALYWVTMDPLPSPKPPVEALSNWEESGDCWCAPAQGLLPGVRLGVLLPNYIYPDEVVIEHVAQSATLDPGAAPEKMELFAKVDYKDVGQISDDSFKMFGPYGDRGFDETYIKLAEWEYIAEASNNIQVFPIQFLLDRYGASTRELVVIALNNSGNVDHTCLYRVLLHGQIDDS